MVTQESFLFNGTIRENLQIGKPDATDEELLEAAAAANARSVHRSVAARIEQRGGRARSKVECRRKAAALNCSGAVERSANSVLDEATASMDTTTERLIQEALETLMFDRTSIIIAHRLSTIVRADQILVLDHGRIIERGTARELLALGGNTPGCANKVCSKLRKPSQL